MEQPAYVRRLLEQKYLLIVGLIVAIVAGLFAGFTIQNGQLVSRTVQTYMASSTVMLNSPNTSIYQVQIPAVTEQVPVTEATPTTQELIVSPAAPVDLTNSAILLAYQAASDQIRAEVEAQIGPLQEGEGITAVRRTTQPSGDETFPGRLQLPILDIAGIAESKDRAELIAATTTTVFTAYVTQQQTDLGVAEANRLVLDEINAPVAGEGTGSNPAIPIIVVGIGVFLLFIALALIIGAIRDRRRARRAYESGDASETDEVVEPEEGSLLDEDVTDDEPESETRPATTGPFVRRRVRSAAPVESPAEVPVPTHTS